MLSLDTLSVVTPFTPIKIVYHKDDTLSIEFIFNFLLDFSSDMWYNTSIRFPIVIGPNQSIMKGGDQTGKRLISVKH